MVISFSIQEARDQLLDKGEVYTYRWLRRAFFRDEKGDVESTWANEGRGTKRIADVEIREIGQFEASEETLEPYWEKSGFFNPAHWMIIVLDFMGGIYADRNGYLYYVSIKSDSKRTVQP